MQIKLDFVNRSSGASIPDILIFQKNTAADSKVKTVAWKVIKHCGRNWHHPFTCSHELEVGLGDGFGNYSPRLAAPNGSLFVASACVVGRRLARRGAAEQAHEIVLKNDLPRGAVNANAYMGGKLIATKTDLAPGQTALFAFKPALWIAAVPQMEEGQPVDPASIDGAVAELALAGIASADIVMRGGGGSDAGAYAFDLENIRKI